MSIPSVSEKKRKRYFYHLRRKQKQKSKWKRKTTSDHEKETILSYKKTHKWRRKNIYRNKRKDMEPDSLKNHFLGSEKIKYNTYTYNVLNHLRSTTPKTYLGRINYKLYPHVFIRRCKEYYLNKYIIYYKKIGEEKNIPFKKSVNRFTLKRKTIKRIIEHNKKYLSDKDLQRLETSLLNKLKPLYLFNKELRNLIVKLKKIINPPLNKEEKLRKEIKKRPENITNENIINYFLQWE
jgi:hypothetical protein